MILTLLTKWVFYATLLLLAYSCVQAANAITKEKSGKCTRVALIMIIVGCAATTMTVMYEFPITFILISLMPMIIGFSLSLIVSDVEAHHKFDKFITLVRTKFAERVLGQKIHHGQ
jgi:hypothetical protein